MCVLPPLGAPLALPQQVRTGPHPFAATIWFMDQGMKMLRAVPASKGAARSQPALRLFRGLKNVRVPAEFARRGGTEIAMVRPAPSGSLPPSISYASDF